MIFFDTETCGLHGPTVLIQWQEDGGDIVLHEVWRTPIRETLALIERICDNVVVGFNLAFDWFHICQTYTTLKLLAEMVGEDSYPEDYITEYAYCEAEARDGDCLKPKSAMDLMLHARKGPYQSLMDRSDVRIRRVPAPLAHLLCDELDKRIPLKDVYFARKHDATKRWKVMDIEDDDGEVVPDFKDVVLTFAPSSALKALAVDALDLPEVDAFEDVACEYVPEESGFAPYALAPILTKKNGHRVVKYPDNFCWFGKWPAVIQHHINHWAFNPRARTYALKDVEYTRRLFEFFGSPEPGDYDSVLACMVGAVRWKGFKVDIQQIRSLMAGVQRQVRAVRNRINYASKDVCYIALSQCMSPEERLCLIENERTTTKGLVLENIAKWRQSDVCDDCMGAGCGKCQNGLIESDIPHPAAVVAREILDYRHNLKEIELYEKLIVADRLHPSFVVIGTLSSRMSGGGGGINAQGIKSATYVREAFKLAFDDEMASGGDFKGFEVSIADAVYKDERLHELLTRGVKIHGLFGTKLFKPLTYEEILATDGLPGEEDKYKRSKNSVFAMLYGGDSHTLQTRAGVSAECAEAAYHEWLDEFKGWGKARMKIYDLFCSMRQPGGIGTRVEWHEPAEYIESLLGFRRYYTLENQIVRALYDLSTEVPDEWKKLTLKVRRRADRVQTASGAVQSALLGAAFGIQSSNMRSAANHEIQSTGGQLTKMLQGKIWAVQPAGVHPWCVRPMNIHDEVIVAHHPTVAERIETIVEDFCTEHEPLIPLIGISWKKGISSWAEKK